MMTSLKILGFYPISQKRDEQSMDIRSAIIQAKKFGGVIKRDGTYFYPTDDFGRTIIYNEYGKIISPGWEPCLEELIASDWEVSLLKIKKPTKTELSKSRKELIENLKKKPN